MSCRSSVVNEESERVESGKAGAVAAAGSAAGSLPFIVASSPSGFASFASLAAVLVTGLLFGVTYRLVAFASNVKYFFES